MQAEVIVVTMKSWEETQQENNLVGRDSAMEAFSKARKRIAVRVDEMKQGADGSTKFEAVYSPFSEQQVSIVDFFLSFYVLDLQVGHFSDHLRKQNFMD
jgi:potassium/chloride transporter 4/5/6